jgi:uncharacterized protein (TIGR03435 family)
MASPDNTGNWFKGRRIRTHRPLRNESEGSVTVSRGRVSLGLVAGLTLVSASIGSQTGVPSGTPAQPHFEVVSIKRAGSLSHGAMPTQAQFVLPPSGRLKVVIPLKPLIKESYGVARLLRVVAPDWVGDECYDITALASPGTKADAFRAMLRAMMAESLGLKVHWEDRPTEVFALIRGPGPLKLPVTTEEMGERWMLDLGFYKQVSDIGHFASYLTQYMDREVIDLTGLAGNYRFILDWSDDIADGQNLVTGKNGRAHPDASVFIKGVKAAGLAIEARRVAIKYLIVDQVSKEPTAN